MEKNQTLVRHDEPKLTIVKKYKIEETPVKPISLRKGKNSRVLLPPEPEQYIKSKKHDFL